MPPKYCPMIGFSAGSINNLAINISSLKVHDQYLELDGGIFPQGKQNVTLSGSYGYAEIPADVESTAAVICANQINDMVRKKVLPDLFHSISSSVGGKQIAYISISPTSFTPELQQGLDPYVFKDVNFG
jgi:hypothetical protein